MGVVIKLNQYMHDHHKNPYDWKWNDELLHTRFFQMCDAWEDHRPAVKDVKDYIRVQKSRKSGKVKNVPRPKDDEDFQAWEA